VDHKIIYKSLQYHRMHTSLEIWLVKWRTPI